MHTIPTTHPQNIQAVCIQHRTKPRSRPRRKSAQRARTRLALLSTARRLFGHKGFLETGTEEIVGAAKVTRGALYYHFVDKAALFAAAVEEIAAEVLAHVEAAAPVKPDPLEGFVAGCLAYLDACLAPAVRRIVVIDAPSVLGPARVREIDARHAGGSLRESVEEVLTAYPQSGVSADALTALL